MLSVKERQHGLAGPVCEPVKNLGVFPFSTFLFQLSRTRILAHQTVWLIVEDLLT